MLTVYTLDQAEQWDSAVRSFAKHDVFWLSAYVRPFRIHGDGEPLLLHYDDGRVRGVNVVMKRDIADDERFRGKIPAGRYFDFATPYGYGGWLLEGGDPAPLFAACAAWCAAHGVVSEFVRFHPMVGNHGPCEGPYEVVGLGSVVHMDLTSPTAIWENMTAKNRNVIRKAMRNDVHIYNGRDPQIYETFRTIYNRTMDRDAAKDYYYFGEAFYHSLLEDMPHNAQVFYAVKDGTVIAASIILHANGYLNYFLSGSLREFSSLAPTNLLLWQAACWGSATGFRTLYLGGGVGSGEDSLFRFKRAFFRGELNRFHIGKIIYCPEAYNDLAALRGELPESGFFPRYRA